MPLPDTREGLTEAGYEFSNEAKCRSCGAEIEWWITPNGKKMPMIVKEVKKEGAGFFAPVVAYKRIPHWSDCANAEDFRGKKDGKSQEKEVR